MRRWLNATTAFYSLDRWVMAYALIYANGARVHLTGMRLKDSGL